MYLSMIIPNESSPSHPSHGVGELGVPEPGHRFAEVADVVGELQRRRAQRQRHEQRQDGAQQGEGTEGAWRARVQKIGFR